MEQLAELLDEAYRLFVPYHMGSTLAVCTSCCVDAQDAKLLQTLKLKDMPVTLIYQYLDAACEQDDPLLISQMKYLLPRILELMEEGAYLRHSTEITLNKCSCMSAEWSVQEIDFLQRFALAYFSRQFENYDAASQVQDVLLMFHLAGLDVNPLLNYWSHAIKQPMVLWGLVNALGISTACGLLNNAFDDGLFSRKVRDWLDQPKTRNVISLEIFAQIDALIAAGLPTYECDMIFDWLSA